METHTSHIIVTLSIYIDKQTIISLIARNLYCCEQKQTYIYIYMSLYLEKYETEMDNDIYLSDSRKLCHILNYASSQKLYKELCTKQIP